MAQSNLVDPADERPLDATLHMAQAIPARPRESNGPTAAVLPSNQGTAPAAAPIDLEGVETYALGPGDRINIDFFNVPEYSGEQQVLVDGSVGLPLVGNVNIRGMTLNQASAAIASAYSQLLRDPLVTVSLIMPRPLRISIAGEVHRPGSYPMTLVAETDTGAEWQWPTVTQAIQQAGGITLSADTRKVQVYRPQPSGENAVIGLNLWDLVSAGDLSQDVTLRDGDTIVIPTADSLTPAEATQLATATFSPATIQVNVVGEVVAPGRIEVPPNTPLNQALLAAGGFNNSRAQRSSVDLVRLNPDGTVTQRQIELDLTSGINDETNPTLRSNDVVIVGRADRASFSDALDGVLDTLGKIFPFFTLF